MAAPQERRLAAIMAADVVGYSRMMEADEAGTLAAVDAMRRELIAPRLQERHGRLVKLLGDGLIVEFASVVDAVACAVSIQRAADAAGSQHPPERRVRLRIGVNLGDVVVEGEDLLGDGVILASRLEQLADPGGVLVSGTAYDHLQGKLDYAIEFLGEQHLKNIARPVRVYRVRFDETGAARPALTLPLPDMPSLAVLPFANLSGDPEQDYFADGMAEEIITALSKISGLFVIARNSSFIYKGRAVDVKQVGRELGVRYVLEGSVRKAGSRMRINGQLIDAASGMHLSADRFDGVLEDVFDLQDQVTASVIAAIAPKLEQAEIARSRRKPTDSLDAYDYYLRGLAALHPWTREGNGEALRLFYRAIELDPEFAAAYGMAARCYAQRKHGGWMTDRRGEVAETERLARRAAELGQDDAVALCTAGIALAFVVGEVDVGAALTERALALNPNLAWAWLFSGWIKAYQGEPDETIVRVARAMRINPTDPHMFSMQIAMAFAHFLAGRPGQALALVPAAARGRPDSIFAELITAASHALLGESAPARSELESLRRIAPELRLGTLNEFFPLRRAEHRARWHEALRLAGLPE